LRRACEAACKPPRKENCFSSTNFLVDWGTGIQTACIQIKDTKKYKNKDTWLREWIMQTSWETQMPDGIIETSLETKMPNKDQRKRGDTSKQIHL